MAKGSGHMNFLYQKARIVVEVYALDDVRHDFSLRTGEHETVLHELVLGAVTEIVSEHFAGGAAPGGRVLDSVDDDEGDGSRLHYWLEAAGGTYRMIVLRFDDEVRTPPVLADTMALVYGERTLICRFVAYQGPFPRSIGIEHIPEGRFSDARPPAPKPVRPTVTVKPLVHRAAAGIARLWAAAIDKFDQGRQGLHAWGASLRGGVLKGLGGMRLGLLHDQCWLVLCREGQPRSRLCLILEALMHKLLDQRQKPDAEPSTGTRPLRVAQGASRGGRSPAAARKSTRPDTHRPGTHRPGQDRRGPAMASTADLSGAHLARVHGIDVRLDDRQRADWIAALVRELGTRNGPAREPNVDRGPPWRARSSHCLASHSPAGDTPAAQPPQTPPSQSRLHVA